jgi:hypothetical protein
MISIADVLKLSIDELKYYLLNESKLNVNDILMEIDKNYYTIPLDTKEQYDIHFHKL